MALKPFITSKIGGMGLWLYIVDEMMKSVKGNIIIRNFNELSKVLPKEFKDWAIIELIFPKII